jgi:hypothetical protein
MAPYAIHRSTYIISFEVLQRLNFSDQYITFLGLYIFLKETVVKLNIKISVISVQSAAFIFTITDIFCIEKLGGGGGDFS